jgi:hypothetical protein
MLPKHNKDKKWKQSEDEEENKNEIKWVQMCTVKKE